MCTIVPISDQDNLFRWLVRSFKDHLSKSEAVVDKEESQILVPHTVDMSACWYRVSERMGLAVSRSCARVSARGGSGSLDSGA